MKAIFLFFSRTYISKNIAKNAKAEAAKLNIDLMAQKFRLITLDE